LILNLDINAPQLSGRSVKGDAVDIRMVDQGIADYPSGEQMTMLSKPGGRPASIASSASCNDAVMQ
jgi:hypothetical protein